VPEFQYEVFDRTGQRLTGQLQAGSAAEAVRSLTTNGHTVVEVSERKTELRITTRRRLRAQDRNVAFHELATLLESGVSLGDAVLAQSRGSHHPTLAAGFTGIGKGLSQGDSFLSALRASGLPMPDYVYHLVEAGEMSGQLAGALRQAERMEKGNIVCLLADGGWQYLSTSLWTKDYELLEKDVQGKIWW